MWVLLSLYNIHFAGLRSTFGRFQHIFRKTLNIHETGKAERKEYQGADLEFTNAFHTDLEARGLKRKLSEP